MVLRPADPYSAVYQRVALRGAVKGIVEHVLPERAAAVVDRQVAQVAPTRVGEADVHSVLRRDVELAEVEVFRVGRPLPGVIDEGVDVGRHGSVHAELQTALCAPAEVQICEARWKASARDQPDHGRGERPAGRWILGRVED